MKDFIVMINGFTFGLLLILCFIFIDCTIELNDKIKTVDEKTIILSDIMKINEDKIIKDLQENIERINKITEKLVEINKKLGEINAYKKD